MRRCVEGLIESVEFFKGLIFPVEGFYDDVASVYFFHVAVDVAEVFLLRRKMFLRAFHQYPDDQKGSGDDTEGDQRHLPADGEHHNHDADQHGNRSDDLRDALV